ncbi:MAG: class I SAM-dependent methyltransferase [Steroidobacteraceae bacterium]
MSQARLFPATLMPDPDWWRTLWPDPDGLVQALRIEPGMTAVDLACGDGYFTAAIARRIAPAEVIGLDLAPAMLAEARAACRALPNCRWQLGDAMGLSRSVRARVDYVLLANTLHGAPDKPALSRQVAAVVKPGGRFGIVNWRPLPREATTVLGKLRGPRTELRMSPGETRAAVEPAGFALEAELELPPYHYAAIFTRTELKPR